MTYRRLQAEHPALAMRLRTSSARTKGAVSRLINRRPGLSSSVQRAWRSPPAYRQVRNGTFRTNGSKTGSSGVRIASHWRWTRSSSRGGGSDHQRYIERDTACEASFGTLSEHADERVRFWTETGTTRPTAHGAIVFDRFGPTAAALPPGLRARTETWRGTLRIKTASRKEHGTLLTGVLDAADRAGITRRRRIARGQDRSPPLPDDVSQRLPREPVAQYRVVLAITHIFDARQRKELVRAWCRQHLDKDNLRYHVAIHRPEEGNDTRNYHAHINISPFQARLQDGQWTVTGRTQSGLLQRLNRARHDPAGFEKAANSLRTLRRSWIAIQTDAVRALGLPITENESPGIAATTGKEQHVSPREHSQRRQSLNPSWAPTGHSWSATEASPAAAEYARISTGLTLQGHLPGGHTQTELAAAYEAEQAQAAAEEQTAEDDRLRAAQDQWEQGVLEHIRTLMAEAGLTRKEDSDRLRRLRKSHDLVGRIGGIKVLSAMADTEPHARLLLQEQREYRQLTAGWRIRWGKARTRRSKETRRHVEARMVMLATEMRAANRNPEWVLSAAEHQILRGVELAHEARANTGPVTPTGNRARGPAPADRDTAAEHDAGRQAWAERERALGERAARQQAHDWPRLLQQIHKIDTIPDADERYYRLAALMPASRAALGDPSPERDSALRRVRDAHLYENERRAAIGAKIASAGELPPVERANVARTILLTPGEAKRLNRDQQRTLRTYSGTVAGDGDGHTREQR